jgi:hypothetical protein
VAVVILHVHKYEKKSNIEEPVGELQRATLPLTDSLPTTTTGYHML